MTAQNIPTAESNFDQDAAAGLSDAEYLADAAAPAVPEDFFDDRAAAGLSDEEYLGDGTVSPEVRNTL
ncbi:hypothetical protein [Arthrobacter koreensis]|uniref:hypothetical protein n=1 Tax=Arthrobacter koreensis TaxID=199136 RepID=UPI003802E497